DSGWPDQWSTLVSLRVLGGDCIRRPSGTRGQAKTAPRSGHATAMKPFPSRDLPRLRLALLAWYEANRRELPWRGTRHPYRIWVSEIMLQQTRVGAVLDRYESFLKKFPSVETLAAAPESS